MKKILIIFGTRPEAIKLAPVISSLRKFDFFDVKICVTAQHRFMMDQVLDVFKICPDFDLDLMKDNQSLVDLSVSILENISKVLSDFQPDLVIVHGDTTTSSLSSLASFYKKIPIAHVEAGLRTGNLSSPWPEEFNRRFTSIVANLHFAPTIKAAENLYQENINPDCVEVTGNTGIDALNLARMNFIGSQKYFEISKNFTFLDPIKKIILVTGHRRENMGDGIRSLCEALISLSLRSDVQIIYPVHFNPNIKLIVEKILSSSPNIFLLPPQDYLSFIYLMEKSYLIVTDSGGIQEEAPSFKKPLIVTRDTTERPEIFENNSAILVGSNPAKIKYWADKYLDDENFYAKSIPEVNPFGDGLASEKIAVRIKKFFKY